MRTALGLAVLALAGCASQTAAQPRATRTQLVGVAASLERLAAAGRFSGAVLVARNGRPVLAHAYGRSSTATGERNRLDTRFNLASLGKTFTAVAVARLVQERKLRFADKIGRYLPGLPRTLRGIQVAQLLDHTSGLGDFFASPA